MSHNSIKCCTSLDLMPIKASKRIRAHSLSSASSASQSDSDCYTSIYSPTSTILTCLGKKVEELEHYIGELEARQDEQSISAEDAHLKHMEEVETFEERIGDLRATIDFQAAKLEIMERDVERLEADNDCLRIENQVIIDERLQDDMTWTHTWHAVQEDLIEYIKSFEV
ncbi:hypothetical protein P692DRAFT_20879210 [Suillus brevipes Sb2]|nr:hypothetical protein P692DRAFT_20879210 [Suillus brevipes Sb2]